MLIGRMIMPAHKKSHLKKLLIILNAILGAMLGMAPHSFCSPRHSSPQAQAAANADVAAAANDSYQAKDWGAAARLYGQITSQQPHNGRAWYRLAVSLDGQGRQDEAIAAFRKSIQAGVPPGIGEYGIALSYASRQSTERAFEYLEKAAQDGFSDSGRLAADVELASLRSDPRFAKAAEQVKRNAKPCAYNPLNRQFDFWVGEWDVVTAEGANPAGSSRIELILGDCVIQEN
jgi:tetratricopeptide (TPR) repeat protein